MTAASAATSCVKAARDCRIVMPACRNPTPTHPSELAAHAVISYIYWATRDEWRFDGPDGAVSVKTQPIMSTNSGDTCRAAALAELVLWIGWLQWHIRTRGSNSVAEPVVHDYGNIVCRDAVLAYDRQELATDADGRTVTSWPTGYGAAVSPSWSSTTFRNALGFTGSESAVLASGIYTLTSTYPALGVLPLRNRLIALDPAGANSGAALELTSGRIAGRQHRYTRDIEVRFSLRGGVGLDESAATYRDEAELYMHRVAPYLWRGARCTVVPDWSDPRMGRSLIAQFTDGVSSPVVQSAQVRGEVAGVMGRKRCEVSSDSADRISLTFAPNRPRVRTGEVSMTLRVLAD